jgi:acetyl esterase
MEKYNIHPDFMKYKNIKPPINPALLPLINFFMTQSLNKAKMPSGLSEIKHKIIGYRGATIKASIFEPAGQISPLPCLVYFHGGAFAMQAASYHKKIACDYALRTPCKVVLVDYRLLPKNVFPVGLEDCYSAFCWIQEHAESLGVDKNRIAVGGDSAGGALAAGVSLLARDREIPMPCFQMLIYPVADERQTSDSMKEFVGTPLWNSELNAKMWRMYLKNGLPEKKEYASPAEAASLEGMPPSYVEVAEYDCLRDEGIAFAKALKNCGVITELYKTQRTVHGFEIAENNEIVHESVTRRIEKLQTAFQTSR